MNIYGRTNIYNNRYIREDTYSHEHLGFAKRALSVYMAIFPIASLYIFAGSITIGQIILLLICLLCIFGWMVDGKIYLSKESHCLLIYVAAVFLNTLFISGSNIFGDLLPRNILQLLYYSVAALFFRQFIDSKTLLKSMRFVSVFSSIYLIIQAVLLLVGVYLPGYIPGLEVSRNDLSIEYYNQLVSYGISSAYRARSIFGEGAEFCQYILCYFLMILDKDDKVATIEKIIMSVAILLSASNLGIIILAVFWIIYFCRTPKLGKIALFLLGIIAVPWLAGKFGFIDIVRRRLFSESSGTFSMGTAFLARFNGYTTVQNMDMSLLQILFGNGVIKLDNNSFMPSNLGHYVCFGLFGAAAYAVFTISCFLNGNAMRKRLVILLSIIGFAANIGFYNFTLFTLVLMLTDFSEEDIQSVLGIQNARTGKKGILYAK